MAGAYPAPSSMNSSLPTRGDAMAGKPKRGLDYFPIDIGFYEKPKIIRLRNKYESMGVDTYLYLLKTIFSQGQFIDETDLECTIINLANHLRTEETKAYEIVRYMVEIDLFDKGEFANGNLTSYYSQETYYWATKRRKERMKPGCDILTDDEKRFIDSQEDMIASEDDISVNKDGEVVSKNRQSISKTKTKSRSERDGYDQLDKGNPPFKVNFFHKWFINGGLLELADPKAYDLTLYFYAWISREYYELLDYFIKYIYSKVKSSNWTDEKGNFVEDKCSYLISAIDKEIGHVRHLKEIEARGGVWGDLD